MPAGAAPRTARRAPLPRYSNALAVPHCVQAQLAAAHVRAARLAEELAMRDFEIVSLRQQLEGMQRLLPVGLAAPMPTPVPVPGLQ